MTPQDLQPDLARLGYDVGSADGILGPRTRGGVLRFQEDFGLEPDGVIGPKTAAALRALTERLSAAGDRPAALQRLSRWRLTRYFLADEAEFPPNPVVPILDRARRILARVDPRFFCHLALNGSGRLRDGRLLNVTGHYVDIIEPAAYAKVLTAARRLFPAHPGYGGILTEGQRVTRALAFAEIPPERAGEGYTVQHGIACRPFFTLAADIGAYTTSDPRFRGRGGLVPVGTRVFILELAGVLLPDGSRHSGNCVVNDTGSAIAGAHADLFSGTRALSQKVRLPLFGHIWFEGSETRCPPTYSYGL
jgi:hypothetical protein